MEDLWRSLRTAGSTLIDRGDRYQEVKDFFKKKQKVSIKIEAKEVVRDDVYDGFQRVDKREAREFALEYLDELSYITDEELEWCLDWREVLINAAPDISLNPDGKPSIKEFEISDMDWLLWIIIAEQKIDLPDTLTYSAVLEGLQWARREQKRKEKVQSIREYLSTNDDYEEAFLNMEYPKSFKDLDPSKFSLSECRMYWLQHYHIPRLQNKGATATIEAFRQINNREPTWGEDLSNYIPPDYAKWTGSILSIINHRLRLSTFRKVAKDPSLMSKT